METGAASDRWLSNLPEIWFGKNGYLYVRQEIPMIRPDEDKSITTDFSEIWTDAQTYRSQLLRSRMRGRVSPDDRAIYGKWRRGVIIFYGLLTLFFLATGAMERVTNANQAMESAQPTASSKVARARQS
jgi:hypothetical protein